MTKFRDGFPGKEWCEHCKDAVATTSVQIPDLGVDLSGNIESIRVCEECGAKIRALYMDEQWNESQ